MDSQDDEVRRKKIETAIKFLQNPRVRQTPMAQRKAFLEKKGLTEEEIAEAIDKSGTAADQHIPPTLPPPNVPQGPHPSSQLAVYQQAAPVSWNRLIGAAVLGGGMSYAIVHLFKTYVLPLIYHKKSEEEEKLDRIETSMSEIRGSVVDTVSGVQNTLDAVQKLLQEQQKQIETLSIELATSQAKMAMAPADSHAVGELKSELLSLKGLLLSRKQFPSPVIGSTPGAASIPTWQRVATTSAKSADPGAASFTSATKPATGSAALSEKAKTEDGTVTQSFDPSSTNGELPNDADLKEERGTPAPESDGCQNGDSACNSTPSTVKSLNDARVEDSLDVSMSDTSLSSLSDLSGNPSFHEASIAFSSTCVKVPSNQTLNCEPESFVSDSVRLTSEDEAI